MKLDRPNGLEYVEVENIKDEKSVIARLQRACFSKAVRDMEKRGFSRFKKSCLKERNTFLPEHLRPLFREEG